MAPYVGRVGWFNRVEGFGFLKAENGSEIRCPYAALVSGGYQTLEEGATVEFELEESDQGPQAVKVRVLQRKGRTP